jgi:hypothetical protein
LVAGAMTLVIHVRMRFAGFSTRPGLVQRDLLDLGSMPLVYTCKMR